MVGKRKRLWCWIGLFAAPVVVASGCSSQTGDAASPPSSLPTSGPTSHVANGGGPSKKESGPSATTTQSTTTQSPTAAASIAPVQRNGIPAHPSISARPQQFDRPVVYSDGVRLTVTGIHQGKVQGQGPGVLSGPKTTFDLRFTNGSTKAISLDQVVPTAVFGSPARVAHPVYDDQTQDFAGNVQPNHSATAVYAFSIPTGQLSDVTIHLDFDSRHYAAVFTGSATGKSGKH